MKNFRKIARAYPFTIFGTITLVGAMLLWAFSQITENQTGLFLSVVGFLLLAFSVLITHIRYAFSEGNSLSCSITASLHAGENYSAVRILSSSWGLPFFLRAHACLSGTLSSGGKSGFHVAREYRISGLGEYIAPLVLPTGGELCLRGFFALRDVLGLSRKIIGTDFYLIGKVRSSSVADLEIKMVHDSVSQDPNALNKQAEQEKIFVREYVPGDLARDVNWKALARIGSLLTRIPPEAPRESKLVSLVVFMPSAGASLSERGRALVQLEHIRVLVSSFLFSVRRSSPAYGFSISIEDRIYGIEPSEPFDAFFDILACSSFGSWTPGKKIPEKSWVIGSVSDVELMRKIPELQARGNRMMLSRMRGVNEFKRSTEAYQVSLFAAFPGTFPALALLAVLVSAKRPVYAVTSGGDFVLELECGVRL